MSRQFEEKSVISEKSQFIVKLWPNLLARIVLALELSGLYLNMVIISQILWPGDVFHAKELGILLGTSGWAIGVSGLIFGPLADRFSRKILMAISLILNGIFRVSMGFIPGGQGLLSYNLFLSLLLLSSFFAGGIYPVLSSYADDTVEETDRSKFYGTINALAQIFQIIGSVLSAILFENMYWREFFWIFGSLPVALGIFILFQAKEPKRGAVKNELKDVLADDKVKYEYKLTKETVKSTILAPTNIIAFFEGIFTTMLLSVPDFLIVAYLLQGLNLSETLMSVIMIIFGIPGAVLGSILFAKLSDKLGNKNIRNRIYLMTFSMVFMLACFVVLFYIPLPTLTDTQNQNLGLGMQVYFTNPFGLLGFIIMFAVRFVISIYNINQPPVLQKINLPEAQGTISSANMFLELIGQGLGPILGGILLVGFGNNYQITVIITVSIGILGAFCWLFASIWIKKDVARVSGILKSRSNEMNGNNQS